MFLLACIQQTCNRKSDLLLHATRQPDVEGEGNAYNNEQKFAIFNGEKNVGLF